ncbi:MAG TPA: hypothetical protein VIX90_10545 [Edaphobacter sp.]
MKVDLKTLQMLTLFAVFALLYAGRMVKGTARETPEGLAFGMKPLVLWGRILVLPVYFALFAYPLWASHRSIPSWFVVLLIAFFAFILLQLPGTVLLTPTAVIQRYWLRPSKSIQYTEVMAVEALQGGRTTRVLGDNRVSITHTWNHCASEQFQQEIARRRADSRTHSS